MCDVILSVFNVYTLYVNTYAMCDVILSLFSVYFVGYCLICLYNCNHHTNKQLIRTGSF